MARSFKGRLPRATLAAGPAEGPVSVGAQRCICTGELFGSWIFPARAGKLSAVRMPTLEDGDSLRALEANGERDRRSWVPTDRPGESVAFSKPLPTVSLLSARGSDRCWAEYHYEYRLCLIRGPAQIAVDYRARGSHTACAGQLMAFEPGDHHVTTRVRGGRAPFDVIGFAPAELQQVARACDLRGPFHFKDACLSSEQVACALERVVTRVAAGAEQLEIECLVAGLLQLTVERCAELPPPLRRADPVRHSGLRAAREALSQAQREPRLDELAEIAGLSRFAFAHAFKQSVGVSPYAYFQLRRAGEARRLIERGQPLSEVVEALGFSDVPHLTRTLKKRLGVPPARWRDGLARNQLRLAQPPPAHALLHPSPPRE
jgi:AraC-like DNA-binding protein